jgi:hypothetical protein
MNRTPPTASAARSIGWAFHRIHPHALAAKHPRLTVARPEIPTSAQDPSSRGRVRAAEREHERHDERRQQYSTSAASSHRIAACQRGAANGVSAVGGLTSDKTA